MNEKETTRIIRLYVREEKSVREIAAIVGRCEPTIRRRLKAARIVMRSNAKRSRLRKMDQARLFSDIVLFGVDETARRWKIPERTLKHYLCQLRKLKRRRK